MIDVTSIQTRLDNVKSARAQLYEQYKKMSEHIESLRVSLVGLDYQIDVLADIINEAQKGELIEAPGIKETTGDDPDAGADGCATCGECAPSDSA